MALNAEASRIAADTIRAQQAAADAQNTTWARVNSFIDSAASQLGNSLLTLAREKIPLVSTVLDGLASGGPIGAVIAVFTELLGKSEALKNIIAAINRFLEPIIQAVGSLLDALWPLIEVVLQLLDGALKPVVWLLEKVIAPALGFVADIIAGIANVFIELYNFLFGWLFGKIGEVTDGDYSPGGSRDLDPDDGITVTPNPKPLPEDDYGAPAPGDSPNRPAPGRTGGNQISNITGPTRDLLISALAPLASLDSLVGIGNRIYDLLAARLGAVGPANLAPAGFGGNITIAAGAIQINGATNPALTSERVLRDLEEKLADRIQFLKRGRP